MASILIVDDDISILFLLAEVLSREKHVITKAQDGSEAIQILSQNTFDLVISDLHMKQVNGIEVLRSVKEQNPDLEVLILTGYGTVNSAVKAMKLGAFDYLTKPLNIEELRLKVRQALKHHEMKLTMIEQERQLRAHQEMIQRDLLLAETIQQTLLPQPLVNAQIEVQVTHRPMIGVGGDFGDIYYDDHQRVYLTIVDVTGHGITAALLVNRVCSEIRKLVREKLQPNEIVFYLNNFISDSFQGTGMFLTACCCLIDLTQHHLSYSGCAHPPLLLWLANSGKTLVLESQNSLIGFKKNIENNFRQDSLAITAGDRLCLYTDGILEAKNKSGQLYGVKGLQKAFVESIKLPLDHVAEAVIESMNRFRHKPIRDDIYLFIAEVK